MGHSSSQAIFIRKIPIVVKIREIKTFFKKVFYVGRVNNSFAGPAVDICGDRSGFVGIFFDKFGFYVIG